MLMIICTWKSQRMGTSNLKLMLISWTWGCTTSLFTISFECKKKKKKNQKLAGLWLTGEVVNHVGIYLDLRRPWVYRRSNIRTYKRKYWLHLSLPIYWSTGVFFASKYFSKTDKLCEKFNPVACFTHALPDHRHQHPNEFFSHIYWDWWNSDNDENKQMNNNLNISAVEI